MRAGATSSTATASVEPLREVLRGSSEAVGREEQLADLQAQKQIRLGKAADAAHGLPRLLGVSDDQIGSYYTQREAAIEHEFATKGDGVDQDNLARILAGTFRDDAGNVVVRRQDTLKSS